MSKQRNIYLFASIVRKSKSMLLLKRTQRGVTSIEYTMIAALIAMAVIGGIGATGSSLSALWDQNASLIIVAIKKAIGKQ